MILEFFVIKFKYEITLINKFIVKFNYLRKKIIRFVLVMKIAMYL